MTKPFISVIVPIYNASQTLNRCLDSLIRSLNEHSEVILINDGSTDNSKEICECYTSMSERIHYLEKQNGGVSTARNFGIDHAKGDYIAFLDSDDYVSDDYFDVLERIIIESECDFIQFSYCVIRKNGTETRSFPQKYRMSRQELMPDLIDSICRKRINQPWAKIYKKSILDNNGIRFLEGASIAEDRVFNIKYSFYINSYGTTDNIVYYVCTDNDQSLSRKNIEGINKHLSQTNEYLNNAFVDAPLTDFEKEQYQSAFNFGVCRYVYHQAKLLHVNKVGWFARQKELWRLCTNVNKRKMNYPNTKFCNVITIPVRFKMTFVLDAIAWKLTR